MIAQRPTITIAILGGVAMVISALEMLLKSIGYDARLLEGAFVEADSAAAHIPIFTLSTDIKLVLCDGCIEVQAARVVSSDGS